MTNADLTKMYTSTIQSYGRKPQDGELSAWRDVLSSYPASHLDAALRRWHSDTAIEDFTQRPRGARLPTPAELKLSIHLFVEQQRKQTTGKFQSCSRCESGWVRIFHGKTTDGNPIDEKTGAVRRCECFLSYVAGRDA